MNLSTPSQWVKETQTAHGILTSKHGFDPKLFITVTPDHVIHLPHNDAYADEWESTPTSSRAVKIKEPVKRDCIPDGLILFEMPESQCSCSACNGGVESITSIYMDPIFMLQRIEAWDKTHKKKV